MSLTVSLFLAVGILSFSPPPFSIADFGFDFGLSTLESKSPCLVGCTEGMGMGVSIGNAVGRDDARLGRWVYLGGLVV